MQPEYPLYVFATDDSTFSRFPRSTDLSYCEEPDIRDGLYEVWDATGRRFHMSWDVTARRPRLESSSQDDLRASIEGFIARIREYEKGCIEHGLVSHKVSPTQDRGLNIWSLQTLTNAAEAMLRGCGDDDARM